MELSFRNNNGRQQRVFHWPGEFYFLSAKYIACLFHVFTIIDINCGFLGTGRDWTPLKWHYTGIQMYLYICWFIYGCV
jgi:hypothetical protein